MPPTVTAEPTLLDKLHEQRQAEFDAWAQLVEARETERAAFETRSASDNKPSEDEVEAFRAAELAFTARSDQHEAELAYFDKRIADQLEIQRRRAEAAEEHRGTPQVGQEPLTYRRDTCRGSDGISYYRDLASAFVPGATFQTTDPTQSLARLQRHAQEMDVEMPKRARSRERRALSQVERAEGRSGLNPFEYRVEPNRTDGQGGYFVPPLWLPDEFIPQLVAHLVAANLCRQMDLPMGTDSINIPKVAVGTAVGYQQADTSGVVSQDWTDSAVQANVKTVAGESDVALQLLEQSPHGLVDEVITTNLVQQYNQFLDAQVIAGDGLNAGQLNGGHLLGLYPYSNWSANSITWTDGSPSGQHFISVLAAMASQISRKRYDLSQLKYVLHGSRYFWYAASLDVNGRPLVTAENASPWNPAAIDDSPRVAEGLAGRTNFGAEIYIDDNVPTNDTTGGGSNQDIALAANWDDIWLFQGEMRTNVYREVLSGSLGVRFQIYNYVAMLARYGQAISVATGSGFSTPQGAVSSIVY